MGMFLRRGLPNLEAQVTLSGALKDSYAYAEIAGEIYTTAGTHVFPKGTSITVFCHCMTYIPAISDNYSKITLNGEIVQEATKSNEIIQFTFPLSGETSINFFTKNVGSSRNYSCDITTN